MTPPLRRWQQAFADALDAHRGPNFLLNAAPGAGKTIATGNALQRLRARLQLEQVIVVCPTIPLRRQWAHALSPWGFELDAEFANAHASIAPDMDGIVVTYQQIAAASSLFAMLTRCRRTVVVLDEIHHAGESRTWGAAVREAFDGGILRLGLSGTPFRQDKAAIPFVTYDQDGFAKPNFNYGYGESLKDGVCREVRFVLRDAEATWEYGDEQLTATFADDVGPVHAARRLRTVVSPACDYMTEVLAEADETLSRLRETKPDAAGLVLAETQDQAGEIARLLEARTGAAPAIAVSNDRHAGETIASFTTAQARWIVAVRMISEGTDIPRLAVEVWATRWRAELFFRQAVGRVVRKQHTDPPGFGATVFLPADPQLRQLASRLEAEVTYKVDEALEPLQDIELKTDGARTDQFVPIGATPGDHEVIVAGRRYTPAQVQHARKVMGAVGRPDGDLAEALESLAAAGLLPAPTGRREEPRTEPLTATKKRLKDEIAQLVGELGSIRKRSESDLDWSHIRGEMNRQLGISKISDATEDQLEQGISYLQKQLARQALATPAEAQAEIARRTTDGKTSYLSQTQLAETPSHAGMRTTRPAGAAQPSARQIASPRRVSVAVRDHIRPVIRYSLRPGAAPASRRTLVSQLQGDPGIRAASHEARRTLLAAARDGDAARTEAALAVIERELASARGGR